MRKRFLLLSNKKDTASFIFNKYIIITASIYFGGAILTEAALGFLGVGTPEFIPTWGNIISSGRAYIRIGFWIAFFPGIFLALTVFATNLVGDGLRDVLDPRLRGQE